MDILKSKDNIKEWDTVRSDCGKARLTYHKEWSGSKPWASFQRGTAGQHFETLEAGIQYLESKEFRFKKAKAA